jgi:vitamin B12 transporter
LILRFRSGLFLTISAAAVGLAPGAGRAQEAPAVTELPPVIIEGATLDAKPVVKAKPKVQAPQAVAEEPEPEPAKPAKKFVKAEKPAKAKKPVAVSAPSAPEPVAPADTNDAAVAEGNTASAGTGDGSTGVAAEKIGTAVSVVTGAQLRDRQIRNGGEALRSLPGVAVSRTGGTGGLTQVRIRGAEGNHTLVLIDGIEANDTFNGEFDFADLSTDDIERIEVIRGPQSGLYGSGAIGGVVNIVTNGGRGPLTFRAMGEAGTFNTYAGSVGVSGGTDKAWGSISINERRTDGFNISPIGSENDGSQLKTLAIRSGVQMFPGVSLDLTLRHTTKFGDRDEQAFDTSGTQADALSTFRDVSWLGAARLTWESLDGHLVQVAKATRNQTERTDVSPDFGSTSKNLGLREDYNYAATYRLDTPALLDAHHYLTGYVERENESFTPNSDFGFFGQADGIERSRSLNAGAVEYRGEYADRLFLQGTVRRDDSSVFGGFNTWRTAASLRLPEVALRPHASYGTGLKLPTLFENFGSIPGQFAPNPNLQPEKSEGWDAGAQVTLVPGQAVVDVTYFESNLTNKINGFASTITPSVLTSENLPGVSTRQGVEIDGRFYVGAGLTLGLAYTYTDARNPSGVQEIRRPKHSGRGDIGYVFDSGRASVNLSAQYVSGNIDNNFGTFPSVPVTLDPYWLVNVAAAYKVAPGVELFGRVENVLDQNYQEIFGFETAGIAAYAGVKFTYEEPLTKDWAKYK